MQLNLPPKGGIVEIIVAETEDNFRLQVKDNGIGIAENDQDLIFTPLYRGDQSRRIIQGMGLGLSIAQDLTRLHGGTLSVESNQGTEVHLPFYCQRHFQKMK